MLAHSICQYRVLLVDDEPFIRTMTARLLADIGCTHFLEASNGREALAILDRPDAHIDLILCDLAMPDMDGVEIVRHLAGRKHRPALAFLSGSDSGLLRATEALARAYGLRILGCLTKPASKTALREVLEHISVEYQPKARSLDIDITEADLGRGIDQGELCLYYQPKVRIDSRALDSVEALVRWNHPTHGLVSPDKFVPLAEAGTLIGRMTETLVALSFQQLKRVTGRIVRYDRPTE